MPSYEGQVYDCTHPRARADTHERDRLFSMKKTVEETYGFTQKLEIKTKKPLPIKQRSIAEYLR